MKGLFTMKQFTKCVTTRNGKTTPFGKHGKLHIEGANLLDENGTPCQLKGLSSHNISCYPEYINEKTISELTDYFNLDVFRYAMYSGFADDVNGYADSNDLHRKELEDLLYDMVETTAKLGIYLIIDWHILLDYDPNIHADMALQFFSKICPVLKDCDHIIYEICNEPNMKDDVKCTWEEISNYANKIIPEIQSVDDSKIIIVGTPIWSQRVDEAAANPLKYKNITYTLHFYADTHKDSLRELMVNTIENYHLPIFVSEFGICDASGNGPVNEEQSLIWLDLLDKYKISYILWNLSNKNETSAILKPDCSKITGFEPNDFSDSGKFLLNMMNRK